MLKRFGVGRLPVVSVICLVLLPAAIPAVGETRTETESEAAAVALLKKGRLVAPVTDAANMAEYLRALANRAGTKAAQSYLSGQGRKVPAPVPVWKAPRPVFEWLAEAINSQPVSLEVDSAGRWCFFEHGDPTRHFSYAASGGVICKTNGFFRSKTRDRIWTMTRLIFDRDLAKEVVATQMEVEVLEAVNSNGKKFPTGKPDLKGAPPKNVGASWSRSQQTITLSKADFPGERVARLRVRGRVVLRTGTTMFVIKALGHTKPVVMTQDGVTVTLRPIEKGTPAGAETWNLPVEIRTKYAQPRGLTSHGESVFFMADDGKYVGRTSWSGRHTKGLYQMTIRIKPHSIDPASTHMVIEYPTGLRVLPIELTFKNVMIHDVKPRPKP